LIVAFCIAQLISSIIAAYANWGFTKIRAVSAGWIGIVWVWNILWFLPLDWIKFAMKATVIKRLRARKAAQVASLVRSSSRGEVPLVRTQSRAASIHESLYSNRVGFIRRAARKVGFGANVPHISPNELKRLGSIQAQHSGGVLARNPSRPH